MVGEEDLDDLVEIGEALVNEKTERESSRSKVQVVVLSEGLFILLE